MLLKEPRGMHNCACMCGEPTRAIGEPLRLPLGTPPESPKPPTHAGQDFNVGQTEAGGSVNRSEGQEGRYKHWQGKHLLCTAVGREASKSQPSFQPTYNNRAGDGNRKGLVHERGLQGTASLGKGPMLHGLHAHIVQPSAATRALVLPGGQVGRGGCCWALRRGHAPSMQAQGGVKEKKLLSRPGASKGQGERAGATEGGGGARQPWKISHQ